MSRPGNRLNGTGSCTPQIMTNMAGTYRYGIIIKKEDGSVRVFRQNLTKDPIRGPVSAAPGTPSTDAYVYFDIANGSPLGDALGLPIEGGDYEGFGGQFDDHYAFAIGVDSQDRLWITGNQHTDVWRAIRSEAANGAWDATWQNAWVVPTNFTSASGDDSFTYHIFDRTSNGTLLWFMSQEDPGGTRGRDWLAFYRPPNAGTSWSKFFGSGVLDAEFATSELGSATVAADITDPPQTGRVANRVYVNGVNVVTDSSTGVEWIHVCGIWRTSDKWGNSQQKPWYVKGLVSGLGTNANWFTVRDEPKTMPITWANKDEVGAVVSITSAPPISRTFGQGIAIDSDGYPHMIYENGGQWQGPLDLNTPDNGTAGDPMGSYANPGPYAAYSDQNAYPQVRLYWDGSDWSVAPITTIAVGASRGPVIAYARNDLWVITMSGSKNRLSNKAGMSVAGALTLVPIGGRVGSAIESNCDPIALKNGVIALMVPDYDTPRVFTYGNHSRAFAA